MTAAPIRVGFIGLNPGMHWAATAHIPALNALPDEFVVTGVATPALPAQGTPPTHSACRMRSRMRGRSSHRPTSIWSSSRSKCRITMNW